MSEETFWNGLPTSARRGTAIVADASEFRDYWARDIVGERIAIVEVDLEGVNRDGGIMYLDDRDSRGWWKVTHGGAPSMSHRRVAIVPGSFEPSVHEAPMPSPGRAVVLIEYQIPVHSDDPGRPRTMNADEAVDFAYQATIKHLGATEGYEFVVRVERSVKRNGHWQAEVEARRALRPVVDVEGD